MATELYYSWLNISYKLKFSILVAIVCLCLSRFLLHGSEIEYELFRYFVPLMAGSSIGYLIGRLLDNLQQSLYQSQKTITQLTQKIPEQKVWEAWYAALFNENQAILILINSTTGRIEEANPSACEFYGYSLKQFKQMHISDINAIPRYTLDGETTRSTSEKRPNFLRKQKLASGEEKEVEVLSGSIVIDETSFLFLVVKDLSETQVLRGIIPICAHCKQIRDIEGDWNQIEEYLQSHSEAKFSHGLCPTCTQQHYPTIYDLYKT